MFELRVVWSHDIAVQIIRARLDETGGEGTAELFLTLIADEVEQGLSNLIDSRRLFTHYLFMCSRHGYQIADPVTRAHYVSLLAQDLRKAIAAGLFDSKWESQSPVLWHRQLDSEGALSICLWLDAHYLDWPRTPTA